jgi:catechol 2,3-dioxygenase-like lactoylglutathione lyase family enzyme
MKKIVLARAVFVTAMMLAVGMAIPCRGQEGGRPKITGIAFVRFKTTDLEAAKKFYGKDLGFASGGPGCTGGTNTCFVVNPHQRVELVKVDAGTTGWFTEEIGFATTDVADMRKYLTSKGVAAGKVMQSSNGHHYFETQDPEGHKIAFESAGRTDSTGDGVSSRMIHAGVVVKDEAVMDKFYKDILGFHLYWKGGMKEGEWDWVCMQVPDGTDWIEYMLEAGTDKKMLGVMNHIALGVEDIRVAERELRNNGAEFETKPQLGRDGKWQLNLYDPDLTRVEFMEFAPVGKPCCSEFTGTQPKP